MNYPSFIRPRSGMSRQVVKAMGIFGGVQVITILCGIVRTKLVAVWIGAVGVGLFGLFGAATDMIFQMTQLSLRQSAVRDLAGADASRVPLISVVVRRWAVMLGVLGAVLTFCCAPLLSEWSFGSQEYSSGFRILSVAVFFQSLLSGEQAVMQGTGHLKLLAQSSLWGAVAGLLLSVPLYKFMGIAGVVPSILAYASATSVAAWLLRVRQKTVAGITMRQTLKEGRTFMTLGLYMTLGAVIASVLNYVFMSYITHSGSTDTLGYYQAGYTLVNRYVGLIFTAMVMEYYPRLTRNIHSRKRADIIMSHEISLIMWCLLPLTALFIGCEQWIITILYASDFMSAAPFMSWAMVGTAMRAMSWSMTYVILAKGDGRIFLIAEIVSGLAGLIFNIIGFEHGGMTGLGIAYAATFLFDIILIGGICYYRYGICPARPVWGLTIGVISVGCIAICLDEMGLWYVAVLLGLLAVWPAYKRIFTR